MKYLSFFSGIGGFEVAIEKIFTDYGSECIGYSEIKSSALKVYKDNFPEHINMGDITKITNNQIKKIVNNSGGCDLIVGGFPCTNLTKISNLCGKNQGLKGEQSKLFYELVRIISIIQKIPSCKNVKFIIENNASMKETDKKIITSFLEKKFKNIKMTEIDNSIFGVQIRKRLFWTNFNIEDPINFKLNEKNLQTWDDVLEPIEEVQYLKLSQKRLDYFNKKVEKYNQTKNNIMYYIEKKGNNYCYSEKKSKFVSKLQKYPIHSDMGNEKNIIYPKSYPIGKSRPILSHGNILIDRRPAQRNNNIFIVREFSPIELERLFGFEDNYTSIVPKNNRFNLLGNSVSVFVIEYVLSFLHEF